MDSKLRCAFEMPLENDKTVSTSYSHHELLRHQSPMPLESDVVLIKCAVLLVSAVGSRRCTMSLCRCKASRLIISSFKFHQKLNGHLTDHHFRNDTMLVLVFAWIFSNQRCICLMLALPGSLNSVDVFISLVLLFLCFLFL